MMYYAPDLVGQKKYKEALSDEYPLSMDCWIAAFLTVLYLVHISHFHTAVK